MESTYKFYMVACDNKGNPIVGAQTMDLEKDFEGLKYSSMEGIETIGAAKNIYSESYSDSDRLRVYVPTEVKHKETEITFTVYFTGKNRHKTYDAFNAYITKGFHRYHDSARNKWFAFYIKSELKPAESMWYGSTPYLKMEYKLSNIFGRTFDVE